MAEEPGDLIIGPADRFRMRLTQAMGVLLVGDVDPATRLAYPIELAQQNIRPIENLQGMAARDEIELVVCQQHLGGIPVGVFDGCQAEVCRHPPCVFQAFPRVV
ncbi:hypothetical protein D3C71_1066290 [compost metagenome]